MEKLRSDIGSIFPNIANSGRTKYSEVRSFSDLQFYNLMVYFFRMSRFTILFLAALVATIEFTTLVQADCTVKIDNDSRTSPAGCQKCWRHPEYLKCMPSGDWSYHWCPSGTYCVETNCNVQCVPQPQQAPANNKVTEDQNMRRL